MEPTRNTWIDRAATVFPVVVRYTGLVCLIVMAALWYFTGRLNTTLVLTFLSLAGVAEGGEFVRDVLRGAK